MPSTSVSAGHLLPPNDPTDRSAEDDSPYPEVRSAVANTDDPDMPCATFRAWFVGLIWAIIIPGLDQFFYFRYPSVTITGVRPHASHCSPAPVLILHVPPYRLSPN